MNEREKRVNALVERIEQHQKALGLNDAQFVARYQRHIGSYDTWRRRLCARDFKGIGRTLDKWEQRLRRFVSELDGQIVIDRYMDLPISVYGRQLYDVLQGQVSDRRVGWLIGPTGVGKSWTMANIKSAHATDSAYIHVNRGAKDSMMVLASMLATATGASHDRSGAKTFQNVVDSLIAQPKTLFIDDIHDGGVLMLKLVKHLIDDTPVKVMLGVYPTSWAALVNGSTEAMAEAQQLIGRSIKPISKVWIHGITEGDVSAYLREFVPDDAERKILSAKCAPVLRKNGNLRALDDAVELARMNADDAAAELEAETIWAAVSEVCELDESGRRGGRR